MKIIIFEAKNLIVKVWVQVNLDIVEVVLGGRSSRLCWETVERNALSDLQRHPKSALKSDIQPEPQKFT